MLKLFFITFFLAELIIATAIILRILLLDKQVVDLNNFIASNQYKVRVAFIDSRNFLKEFAETMNDLKDFIEEKRREYITKALKTLMVYSGLFLLKGKYRKTLFAYQIAKEIYEGIKEED